MPNDFVATLGRAMLAHRFRRMSELFLEGMSAFLARQGFEGAPRSASTVLLLRERGQLGITEIAHDLRLSHPLIIKFTAALAAKGLVADEEDPSDGRRRVIALTKRGEAQAERLTELTRIASEAFGELGDEIGVDLLDVLERLEKAASARSIEERLNERMPAEPEFQAGNGAVSSSGGDPNAGRR